MQRLYVPLHGKESRAVTQRLGGGEGGVIPEAERGALITLGFSKSTPASTISLC